MNKEIKSKTIAFDVDQTLITYKIDKDYPRYEIIEILKTLKKCGHKIIVWSGGGKDYAEMWVRRLFLEEYVDECSEKIIKGEKPDIAFDDQDVELGKINIKV